MLEALSMIRSACRGLVAAALIGTGAWAQGSQPGPSRERSGPARSAPAQRGQPARTPQAAQAGALDGRVAEALGALEASGDYRKAAATLRGIIEAIPDTPGEAELPALRDAAFALRLVQQVEATPEAGRSALLKTLRAKPALARAVAFAVAIEDDVPAVYDLLRRLMETRGEAPAALSNMTAALCVVRDRPLTRRVNENTATAADALKVFDYYARNERAMMFPLRTMPVELLVHVIDPAASVEELEWALGRYKGSGDVGSRFFDVSYDMESFGQGAEKAVTRLGFTLENILSRGGVCADQSHFASTVGKAIGVPSVWVTAVAAEGAHAWVGFLRGPASNAQWDFDAGRYDAFKGLRGVVTDPQTGKPAPDGTVSLLAGLMGVAPEAREASLALADAARLAAEGGKPARALALAESAATINPACLRAWAVVRGLAEKGAMTAEQKRHWGEAASRFCGERFPDFTLEVYRPMVESETDPAAQDRMWNALATGFERRRPDLGAEVRILQARACEKQSRLDDAVRCYQMAAEKHATAGAAAGHALMFMSALLQKNNRTAQAISIVESAWRRMPRPDGAVQYRGATTWFRTGLLYSELLRSAGRAGEAERVMGDLTR